MSPVERSSSSASVRVNCANTASPSGSSSSTRTSNPRWLTRATCASRPPSSRLGGDRDVVRAHEPAVELGHRAEEAHHEAVRGPLVELARAAGLHDVRVVHDHDVVGDRERLLLVVGDQQRRHVHVLVQAPQPLAQLRADLGVQRAERLVEQEHARLDRQCAGERHPLALAARELGRVAPGEPRQPDDRQQLRHAGLDLVLRLPADLQPEGDVLAHGHVLERRVVLEHEPDLAPLRGDVGHVLAVDLHAARVRELEPADDPQQRRLARARRPEQRGQRAVRDIEGHVVERHEVTKALRHVLDGDHVVRSLRCTMVISNSVMSARPISTVDAE